MDDTECKNDPTPPRNTDFIPYIVFLHACVQTRIFLEERKLLGRYDMLYLRMYITGKNSSNSSACLTS